MYEKTTNTLFAIYGLSHNNISLLINNFLLETSVSQPCFATTDHLGVLDFIFAYN